MKTNKKIFPCLVALLICLQLGLTQDSYAQKNDSLALSKADTVRFLANNKEDWKLYNSFLEQATADSVSMEVIIMQAKPIDWKTEHLFGKVKDKKMLPKKEQNIVFRLLNDSYAIRVGVDGKCYIKMQDGNPPSTASTVLPIKINYKND